MWRGAVDGRPSCFSGTGTVYSGQENSRDRTVNRKDLSIARSFKRLVQQRIHPLDVRVFGSRARGDAAPDSDLDVFVVVDHATSDIERYISDCAWEAGFEQDVVIVPVVVGKDRIDGPLKESVFILNVFREGVEV